jgi:hypothetical protein
MAKAKVGRPTGYDPAYCARVIELGKAGKSKVQMAAEFDVCRNTIENWARDNPEFLSALTRASTHAQAWWENAGQTGISADKFNGSVWSRSMAARFPEDWREKTEQNVNHGAQDSLADLMQRIDGKSRGIPG